MKNQLTLSDGLWTAGEREDAPGVAFLHFLPESPMGLRLQLNYLDKVQLHQLAAFLAETADKMSG